MYRSGELRLEAISCRKKQAGAALLLVMLFLLTVASFLFLDKLNSATNTNSVSYQNEYQRVTARALAEAKAALIGYAMTYSEKNPGQPQGFLPCPDEDGDGSQPGGPCGSAGVSVIGWFPWEDLRTSPLRDGAGECLWYAVSGNYKNNRKSSLTSDTNGQFIVRDGAGNTLMGSDPSASDRAIALIFAPGAPIAPQLRAHTPGSATECGSSISADAINQASNYLEFLSNGTVSINNSNGTDPGSAIPALSAGDDLPMDPSRFVSASNTTDADGNLLANDMVVAITPQDFVHAYVRMDKWVADRVRQCLNEYESAISYYPWAAVLDPVAAPEYDDDPGERFGRIPSVLLDSGGNWPNDPNALYKCFDYTSLAVQTGQPAWSWWWWNTWREMVFYAVDADYAPTGTASGTPTMQLIDTITPTPTPPESQFVIVAAGRKLPGQNRISTADKADISNYLEDHNNPAYAGALPPPLSAPYSPGSGGPGNIPTGDEQSVAARATPASPTPFNDTACNNSSCP